MSKLMLTGVDALLGIGTDGTVCSEFRSNKASKEGFKEGKSVVVKAVPVSSLVWVVVLVVLAKLVLLVVLVELVMLNELVCFDLAMLAESDGLLVMPSMVAGLPLEMWVALEKLLEDDGFEVERFEGVVKEGK